MSLLDRLRGTKTITVENAEPNRIDTVGIDDIRVDLEDPRSQNWVDFSPRKIKPTIKNCRRASQFPSVYGILNNLIMKTISSYVIDGDDEEAIEYIIECAKDWNLRNLMYECLWKCLVDGELFYNIDDSQKLRRLRLLAFDGEKSLIKKIYDEDGITIKGYKQLVVRREALKKWKNVTFWETYQEQDVITVDFEPDEITNPQLISIDGVGQSLVRNVIDIAYYLESLVSQMPMVVFKSANIMVATLGNADRGEYKVTDETRDYVADQVSNYHKKGVVTLPWGITLDAVGNSQLPAIEKYIKSIKSMLYEGLISPESMYSSESSNRSTAQVQLTSEKTGYILFIQFAQEFLKDWIESVLIDPQLEKNNMKKGSVYISFQTTDADLDEPYLIPSADHTVLTDSHMKNEKGSTSITTDDDPYDTYTHKNEGKN